MRPRSARELLAAADVPAFLVSDLLSLKYLTGLPLSAGFLLALPRRFVLFVDARYTDMALRRGTMAVKPLDELPSFLEDVPACGFEAESVTVLRQGNWKRRFKKTKFIKTSGVVASFRRQKEEWELQRLRRARRITQELLRRVPAALRKQTTEEKLARQLHMWALELGADGLSFDPIVAFGTHTSSPHHAPTSRTLKKGHLVQIDVGARYRGYCADMSEVFFTVKPTPLQERIYKTLQEAKKEATLLVKTGVSTHVLDKAARKILDREGIEEEFTHSLGHGVGLEIHEGLTLSQKSSATTLLKNEVITIEPGVYFPGRFGMRVEDMVFVE